MASVYPWCDSFALICVHLWLNAVLRIIDFHQLSELPLSPVLQYGERILAIEGNELPIDLREAGLYNQGREEKGFAQQGEKTRRSFAGVVIDAYRLAAVEGGAQLPVGRL